MKTLRMFLAVVVMVVLFTSPMKVFTQQQGAEQTTKIVLLGTGTPHQDPDRSGPCVAIVVNDTPYLVDMGPGLVRRAAAARRAGLRALVPRNLKHVFVTHLHSDHTVGYPDLIFSPWVVGRKEPLKVYGPEGIGAMTKHILAAYQQDIRVRLDGLEPANTEGYKVDVHETEPGVVYQDANVTVEAFPVKHGAWPQSFGFKFTTPDRTIVISGDTVPTESIVRMSTGCDVLIHEAYSATRIERRGPRWQKYHRNNHTSTYELGEMAAKAKPGLVILYHQIMWGATEEELVAEVREKHDGEVVSGKDLQVY